jgi:hypothetical protein
MRREFTGYKRWLIGTVLISFLAGMFSVVWFFIEVFKAINKLDKKFLVLSTNFKKDEEV